MCLLLCGVGCFIGCDASAYFPRDWVIARLVYIGCYCIEIVTVMSVVFDRISNDLVANIKADFFAGKLKQ